MFENIGEKIKGVAKAECLLGILISVSAGLALAASGINSSNDIVFVVGILIALGGSVLSWIGSLLIYGFGVLVENSYGDNAPVCKTEHTESPDIESQIHSDWICTKCSTVNPYTSERCNKCGTLRGDADWVCAKCGTPNHHSTTKCDGCGTPRA